MNRAYGVVNAFVRDGVLVYEAMYQPSYRHNVRRIDGGAPQSPAMWSTEAGAITALERAAEHDGLQITVQAGKYPHGTRTHGQVLSR